MIPKIIHYCWFGNNEKSELAKLCIESWHRYCPEYIFIEWNESNFNIAMNDYIKEAYEAKKWAFVTDYVRLYVLYNFGGVYLDTDVELIKSIDPLLIHNAYAGYETENTISTGQVGAVAGNRWIKQCIDCYEGRHFLLKNGKYDETTNVELISNCTSSVYDIKLNGKKRDLGEVILYPKNFFSPKNPLSGKMTDLTGNTYSIHHFAGSWLSEEEQEKKRRLERYRKYVGWWFGLQMAEFSMSYEEQGIEGVFRLLIEKIEKKYRF